MELKDYKKWNLILESELGVKSKKLVELEKEFEIFKNR